jgi:hypothetical protein
MLNLLQKMKIVGNLNTSELSRVLVELHEQVSELENKIKELEKNDRPKVSKNTRKTNKTS